MNVAIVLALLAAFVGKAAPQSSVPYSGRQWTEADAIFRHDPRWLGSDAALSIPLGRDRTLWLFGDTFIATTAEHLRTRSKIVRNTIAVQTGSNPLTASIVFKWRESRKGSPASFFPEPGRQWYGPGHGVRLEEGPLVIFLGVFKSAPGQGLGFTSAGNYAVAVIDNPDALPDVWKMRIVHSPRLAFDAIPATAVLREGNYVYAVAIRQEGTHAGALVRYPAVDLARGDLRSAEWWLGNDRGWVKENQIGKDGPSFVLDDAGSECSLHWDARSKLFIHIASYGSGPSTIGMRTAAALTGPWSKPVTVFRPPESDRPRALVYAAKAHPELVGPDASSLVVTYAANSFSFEEQISEQGQQQLYWPRFVAIPLPK